MREIKFKGLYETDNKKRTWTYYGIGGKPVLLGAHWIVEDLQYTGLHDKNGKEIYEGDIVSILSSECGRCPEKEACENGSEEGDCPLIEIERDSVTMTKFPKYWLEHESFGWEGEGLISPDYTEIIGNIYENPELVEVKG